MRSKDWVRFILCAVIWGTSFLWIKIGVQEIGPFTLVLLRVSFALLGTLVFVLWQRQRLPSKTLWLLPVLGLFNVAIPFVLISWAEVSIDSGLASVLNSTAPLFTALLAGLLLTDDRLTLPRILGLLIGFSGVMVLVSAKIGTAGNQLMGVAAMLAAALCYAASAVIVRKSGAHMSPAVQAFGQSLFALLVMLPAAAVTEAPLTLPRLPITWLAVAWLGLLGSFIASLLYLGLIQDIGPTRALLTTYLFPLIGAALGAIFLHEQQGWQLWVGAALILSGIGLVNQVKRKPPAMEAA